MQTLDIIVLITYISAVVGVGFWFARRSSTSDGFMKAGGRLPSWVVGLSLFGTFLSSNTFIGVPGKAYAGNWNAFVFSLSIPIAVLIATRYFVKFYRDSGEISAYEHLEKRFGLWARIYTVICYLLTQVSRTATIMLGVAIGLQQVTGWSLPMIILVAGVLVTAYTLIGGIEAVIWTDAIQSVILTIGALLVVWILIFDHPEGASVAFSTAFEAEKFSLGSWSITDLASSTVWSVLVFGLFINLANFGIDQNYIQRYHTAKSEEAAKKALWTGAILYVPISLLFFLIGSLLYSFYQTSPEEVAAIKAMAGDRKFEDSILPHFMTNHLPPGVGGLILAALAAAAMSTIDTSLNSSATITLKDLWIRLRRGGQEISEIETMRVLHWSTIFWGILGTGTALILTVYTGNVLDIWWKLSGVFAGGMLGLFLLGMIARRAGSPAAVTGVIVGVLVIFWLSFSGASWMPENIRPMLHSNLTIVLGTMTIFFVGLLVSPIYKQGPFMNSENNTVLLIASGDSRLSANRMCWPAQQAMEGKLNTAVDALGFTIERAHDVSEDGHGFIDSQRLGMDIFCDLDPDAPIIVAEAVWQYSHHVLAGLTTHRGPILTVANWSGQWPGLVGMLNLNGSLTKAGVKYSTLWSGDFTDDYFVSRLGDWLESGTCSHEVEHVRSINETSIPADMEALGNKLAQQLRSEKSIMGVFDEGCMGMFNAIIPDHLLNATGVFKERLSQSALIAEAAMVSGEEARSVFEWYLDHGFNFHFGPDENEDLTEIQVIEQCRIYIAAVRIADDFGCESIGIQYQLGLKDVCPASDLVEGTLNSSERPPVFSRDGSRELFEGRCIPHFNEVDECAGLDAVIINRLHTALDQPVETTLHDLRWGDFDQSGTTDEYIWVFEISGSAPAEHHGGWDKSHGYGQPRMFFPKGGATLSGVAKAGEIIWSRIYIANDALHLDIGRGKAIDLPEEETQRRLESTTSVWPIIHGVTYGVSRDQMMARHKANHVQVVYATDTEAADQALLARAAFAHELGIKVSLCGCRKDGSHWN